MCVLTSNKLSVLTFIVCLFQILKLPVNRKPFDGRHYMESTLKISAVRQIHSGTYTCTAINDAGVAIATTQLRVLGINIW